jgi:tetratricopeptide (TPR) repeat protein
VSERRFKGVTWSFGQTGRDDPQDAYRQLAKIEALRQQEQFDRALTLCQPLVARHPDYYGALYTLGLIYADKGEYPQALGCLVRAVMLDPRSWKALTALGTVYLELGASEMAAQTLEQARAINPQDAGIFATLGEIYRAEREYELAYNAFRSAVELDPKLDIAALGLGTTCMHLGRLAEAAKVFEALMNRGNHSLIALAALAEMPSSLVSIDVLSELQKTVPDKKVNRAEFDTALALIKAAALDKLGKTDEAWQLLVDSNRSIYLPKQQDAREVNETQTTALESLKRASIKPFLGGGSKKTISLFIFGPSRSGKTTMEALLGALEGVKRGYENPIVENAVRRTFQSAGLLTERAFDLLPSRLEAQCREFYADELERRAGSATVFTNTHPARIYDAARLASAFPNVRLIFVKRHLNDNLLRVFMRRYAVGNSYSYNLKSARDHIEWYHQMIDTLASKLPHISRVIQYEDIIADPESALQIGADLCGLRLPRVALPEIGDDRGCSKPYQALIAATLAEKIS